MIDARIKRIGFGDEAVRKSFLELKIKEFAEIKIVTENEMLRLLDE